MKYRPSIVRVRLVREPAPHLQEQINGSVAAARVARYCIGRPPREQVVSLLLGAKRRLLGVELLAQGTAEMALVHPREVFQSAILANAMEIIMAHNHPSGDPTPSKEDGVTTRRLLRAGRLLGIPLVDHIILGARWHWSYADRGCLR